MSTSDPLAVAHIEIELKILYPKRDALYNRMQTILDHAKEVDDETSRDTFLCEMETVEKLRLDFESVLDRINIAELKLKPSCKVNYQVLNSFDDLLCRAKRIAKGLSPPPLPPVKPDTDELLPPARRTNSPRLPPIELPDFNGDIKNWPLFFSSFTNTVHNNTSLTDSERLYYLIGKLKGKAQTVCAGITPSAENYVLFLNALKNKYEDKRLLASSYLQQILDLKSISTANTANLEHYLDTIASAVAALKNIKLDNLADFLFFYIALSKLDSETVRSFEQLNRGTAIPSFDELIHFVRDHIRILQRTTPANKHPQRSTHSYVSNEVEAPAQPPPRPASNHLCRLCKGGHDQLYRCPAFQVLSPRERFNFVKSNNFCFNCLSFRHLAVSCNSNTQCHKCHNRHHTMLHFDRNNFASSGEPSRALAVTAQPSLAPSRSPSPAPSLAPAPAPALAGSLARDTRVLPGRSDDVTLCSLSDNIDKPTPRRPTTVLLATARVIVVDSRGREHSIRVLLDSASQSNFVTRECCDLLGLSASSRPVTSVVKGIGGLSKKLQGMVSMKFYSRLNRNVCFNIDTLVVDKVTESLPTVEVDVSLLSSFSDLRLADETYSVPGNIDMLIGASIFPHLLLPGKVRGHFARDAPYALNTVLGYVIVGSAPVRAEYDAATVSYCCAIEALDSVVRKFWEIEEVSVPPNEMLSPDDKDCEEIYCRTTTRDNDGRYIVALPFKGSAQSLGDSRKAAERRFLCLEKKLEASSKLREAYDGVIKEYISKDYISRVTPQETSEADPGYYIPHHGVIRDDKVTSKLRVVLDASAKTSTSVSLNDILHNGQNLQKDLFSVIVNFRLFKVALSADIRQMFLCIGVRECDRRFQRILYRFSPSEPLSVYEFNRVCFGLKSSPFHALRTIKQLAADEGDSYPRARKLVETGLYMDDVVYCVDTPEEAVTTSAEVISLMKAGQFDLVKWTANSNEVLESIPESHRLSSVKEFDESDLHKVLGLCWSPVTDLFHLKVTQPAETCTKRTILSCVARIWDIMGFVAPVVLYAKLLIKELWLRDCDWDAPPPEGVIRLWAHFRDELPFLDRIKIPRHLGITKGSIVTILGFADASEKAYGAVVYFHVENCGIVSVSIIAAKSRVSPRKVVSVARLELCALYVLAKLIASIVSACNSRINIDRVYAFSDSTVALCWAHSSPDRWDTFVANRVAKIEKVISKGDLFHVSGHENPADCLSRGLTPAQIIDHPLWFSGPHWAKSVPSQWPISDFNPSTVSDPPEEKRHSLVSTATDKESLLISLSKRFSSWSKLLRCLVYICRFAKLLPPSSLGYITASELEYAELLILREVQHYYFFEEISSLRVGKACKRTFQRLRPFLKDGLIRVGGRLANAALEFDQRHPIVLPHKDHILDLLIDYHHKVNCHAGPDLLMSLLRQKYWVISARALIRNRVHKCLPCFRLRPQATFPEMADHRSCRVIETAKPFVHTGTDYAGPFKVTLARGRGVRSTKAYICLFVCMTTRAVHIELVGDLSTDGFMGAFKRFISRRGPVGRLYSDNGTNYIGAKKKLSELHGFLTSRYFHTEFAHTLAENRIKWILNAPAASHFGGNWEANIKSLKSHLYRVIGDQILTFEELSTVLAQVEAVMNSRPLCRTLSSDPSEPLALTPAHFLSLTPLKYLPASEYEDNVKPHLLSRHSLLEKLVQSFWKRWRLDYLHTLQARQKWNTPTNPITTGTVVVLTTENAPPLHWPLGIVEEVFPGADGITRIARVRTATTSFLRPVVRLCPLPNQ